MRTKEQRYNELYSSGLVKAIKDCFSNRNDISEEYYVLMADYIKSMYEIKDEMLIDPIDIAVKMPELVKSIKDAELGGIYGITDNNEIQINKNLSYEQKKLYFFHELTHALQTSYENNVEQCGFYNGHDGMFLTEGATQYTAEMLYNVSNGTRMNNRLQPRSVRGANNRIPNSPLSEYQYNGDILALLAQSMDLPLPQVLTLAYKRNGREALKNIYESMEGNQGKFDELMNNLEQIYTIDKLLIYGYGQQLQSQTPLNITMQDRITGFQGNLNTYRELMDKTERELVATYMRNHDKEYILQHYNEISQYLTTPELQNQFISEVQQLTQEVYTNNDTIRIEANGNTTMSLEDFRENISQPSEFSVGTPNINLHENADFYINEYGEIIRPERNKENNKTQIKVQGDLKLENKLSLKQKVARFLQKNNLFMNLSFVENFVHKQLDVLPSTQIENAVIKQPTARERFMEYISNNGKLRNMPQPQRMWDLEKLEKMRRDSRINEENDGR